MSYQKFYSNQIHSSSLLCHLSQMWKDQILCDALIRTGPITTKAHRLVLIAACPMLQSMENAAAGSHLEVRLAADIKQDAVNTFLQYLYEGFMMLTEENCRDVEKVARLLQVDGVIKCCSDFYKCYQNKTGIVMQHGGQHKYSFQDLVEFRHVRSSDIIKSANERMMKRTSEFSRPGSPGGKRQRMHHTGSPHTEGPSFRSSAEDMVSMTDSYRSHHPDIWERVPRTGAAKSGSGRSLQPGVIDIVEDSIEIVQTDTVEKDPSRPLDQQRQTGQRSVAISIASQITDNNDLRIVNITGSGGTKDGTGSRTNMSATSTTSSSRGQTSSLSSQHLSESFQHLSPQSISSPSSSQSSLPRTTDRTPSLSRQQELQQRAQDYLPNLGSDIELVPVSKPNPRLSQEGPQSSSGPSPRQQPFPVSISPVGYPSQASVPPKPFSAGSFPTAAAGSANQVMGSPHSVPSPGARGPRSQSLGSQGRSDSTERISPANEGGKEQSLKDKGESSCSSTADMTPDLSIVKIEKTPGMKDDDTGGLDMYVDMADNSTMVLQQASTGDDDGEKSDEEHDEALEEWAREEMANEGSNISGEHGAMAGSFKGSPFPAFSLERDSLSSSLMENHRPVRNEGYKYKCCVLCQINKVKTRSGWRVYTHFKCEKCDVPLCIRERNCFTEYHRIAFNDNGQPRVSSAASPLNRSLSKHSRYTNRHLDHSWHGNMSSIASDPAKFIFPETKTPTTFVPGMPVFPSFQHYKADADEGIPLPLVTSSVSHKSENSDKSPDNIMNSEKPHDNI